MELLTWIVSALALTGTILNSSRNKYGFILWFFTNLFWCVVDFKAGLYAQSGLFLAYTILAVKGILTWSRLERSGNNERKTNKISTKDNTKGKTSRN